MTGLSIAFNPEEPSVWLCGNGPSWSGPLPEWLTEAEGQRLAAMGAVRREEFLRSRWLLRQAMSCLAGGDLSDWTVPAHRPDRVGERPQWRVSITHTSQWAVCAINPQGAIGVDLETAGRRARWESVARRWFHAGDQQWLVAQSEPGEAFLRLWTLKEAWIKATSRGIAGHLQSLKRTPEGALEVDRPAGGWRAATMELDSGNWLSVISQHACPPHLYRVETDTETGAVVEAVRPRTWQEETLYGTTD